MSWGYKHSTVSFAKSLQSNKKLINETPAGTKIYKSVFGQGLLQTYIVWKDNRSTSLPSVLIINKQVFNVDHLKSQKTIFEYAEELLRELQLISVL